MRGIVVRGTLLVVVGGFAFVVLGCPPKKSGGDDGGSSAASDSGATATATDAGATPSGPEAMNDPDIRHYPDETKLDHVPGTIQAMVANVKTGADGAGDLVSVLKKNTDVQKIADRGGSNLILFKEPSAPGRQLGGWVLKSAFTPQILDAGPTCIACGKQTPIMLEKGEQCVIQCNSSNDTCPTNMVCNGDAPLCSKGQPGDMIEFCVTGIKQGGTPGPTGDAGTTKPDAGTTTADAGGGTFPGCITLATPPNFTCPAGQKLQPSTKNCRPTCNTNADCKCASPGHQPSCVGTLCF